MLEAYTFNKMSTDTHDCYVTWTEVINALIQHFWNERVLQKLHDIVTQASQRLGGDKLNRKTWTFKAWR